MSKLIRLNAETILRILILASGLSTLLFLVPGPDQLILNLNQATGDTMSHANLDSAIKTAWLSNLVLAIVGVAVAMLAWRRTKHWEKFALLAAFIYLCLEAINILFSGTSVVRSLLYFQTRSDFLNAIQMRFKDVELAIVGQMSLLDVLKVFAREVLMPLLQFAIFVWLLIRLVTRSRGNSWQSTNRS
ncbi:MAG TPA: hypothetical protein VFV71_12735 [Burkholderiales bacterium]|nr:hypothetical protein [Burkholderiales bacterium]